MKKAACLILSIFFTFLSSVAFGETVDGKIHMQLWDGRSWRGMYSGEIMNGVPHGYGTWKVSDNDTAFHYIGIWESGNMHGNGGLYYWKTGEAYIGYFENNEIVEGTFYINGVKWMYFDTRTDENNFSKMILYREDGSIIFDGGYRKKPESWNGGIYSADGKKFMDVEIMDETNFAAVIELFE